MNLLTRIASAAVLIAILVAVLVAGSPYIGIAIAVVAALAAWEVGGLIRSSGRRPFCWLLIPLAVAIALHSNYLGWSGYSEGAVLVVTAICIALGLRFPDQPPVLLLAAAAYVGLIGYFLVICHWPDAGVARQGVRLVAIAIGGTVLTDTGAYFVGRVLGKHLLAPAISPKKTVEGAIGGALVCVAAVALVAPHLVPISTAAALGLGAVITVAGQLGDLFESFLKRRAGVKDSSHLIPGHGGLLDRLDSLLLVSPLVYTYLKLIALS